MSKSVMRAEEVIPLNEQEKQGFFDIGKKIISIVLKKFVLFGMPTEEETLTRTINELDQAVDREVNDKHSSIDDASGKGFKS